MWSSWEKPGFARTRSQVALSLQRVFSMYNVGILFLHEGRIKAQQEPICQGKLWQVRELKQDPQVSACPNASFLPCSLAVLSICGIARTWVSILIKEAI